MNHFYGEDSEYILHIHRDSRRHNKLAMLDALRNVPARFRPSLEKDAIELIRALPYKGYFIINKNPSPIEIIRYLTTMSRMSRPVTSILKTREDTLTPAEIIPGPYTDCYHLQFKLY